MKRTSLPKNSDTIHRNQLLDLYDKRRMSVAQISRALDCSENKINYWLAEYNIKKRSISDAMYQLKNPLGDPFLVKKPRTHDESFLLGMGLGLYWGEGSKRGTGGVRLTNTDPKLLKKFIEFLERLCTVERTRLKFSLQVFDDVSASKALNYWVQELGVKKELFYKVVVSKRRGTGTYRHKSEHGVIIVYFNNIKLKKIICQMIENIQ